MTRNGDVMRSDRLKQVMQQIDPNFDERNAGFNRFSKFVVEAGQKGVVHVVKLDNGQYEVAPAAGGAGAAPALPAPPARPREGAEAPREENGRRGRGGRRGGRGRERGPARERTDETARETPREAPPARAPRAPEGTLTLAGAFQLMAQALAELRAPVPHDALRLRMVALHGREDPLLDASRFPRLLRQANDAEIADVRKVGDDEYEVSPHRTGTVPAIAAPSAPQLEELVGPGAAAAEPSAEQPGRENGQRLGLRFRRGSRGPTRTGEVPLVGVVQIDAPAPAEAEPAEPVPSPAAKPARKTTRARTPRKKQAAAAPVGGPGEESTEPAARTPKRPRSRAKKKTE